MGDGKVEGSRERREREGGEEMRGNKVQGRVEDCGDGDGSARARESLRTVSIQYLGTARQGTEEPDSFPPAIPVGSGGD